MGIDIPPCFPHNKGYPLTAAEGGIVFMRQCMDSENLHRRLKKIIGQVQAIDRMVDEDVPCEDILAQINAAKSALHKVGQVGSGRPYQPLCPGTASSTATQSRRLQNSQRRWSASPTWSNRSRSGGRHLLIPVYLSPERLCLISGCLPGMFFSVS